jgi:hypothetical protein
MPRTSAFQPGAFQNFAFQTQEQVNGTCSLPGLVCNGTVFFGYYSDGVCTLPFLECDGYIARGNSIDGECTLPALECDGDLEHIQAWYINGECTLPTLDCSGEVRTPVRGGAGQGRRLRLDPLPDDFYFRKPPRLPRPMRPVPRWPARAALAGACELPTLACVGSVQSQKPARAATGDIRLPALDIRSRARRGQPWKATPAALGERLPLPTPEAWQATSLTLCLDARLELPRLGAAGEARHDHHSEEEVQSLLETLDLAA